MESSYNNDDYNFAKEARTYLDVLNGKKSEKTSLEETELFLMDKYNNLSIQKQNLLEKEINSILELAKNLRKQIKENTYIGDLIHFKIKDFDFYNIDINLQKYGKGFILFDSIKRGLQYSTEFTPHPNQLFFIDQEKLTLKFETALQIVMLGLEEEEISEIKLKIEDK